MNELEDKIDFDKRAVMVATVLGDYAHSWHRGALERVIFGNDGYSDPRVKREIELVRAKLVEMDVKEIGFGVAPEGYSWALIVDEYVDQDDLRDIVNDAWREACGVRQRMDMDSNLLSAFEDAELERVGAA